MALLLGVHTCNLLVWLFLASVGQGNEMQRTCDSCEAKKGSLKRALEEKEELIEESRDPPFSEQDEFRDGER